MLESLKKVISPERVLNDSSSLMEYGRDWVKYLTPNPTAIVFPKTTEEVVGLVNWARQNKIALVPSGGRTGLSGGAAALNGEVVVSFEKMNQILEFNPMDQTLTVEAGVITETIQKYAQEKGLYYPVDFASRGSSQIGGNVATNAGGIKVLRFGLTRSWVMGLEVVTGQGEVLKLNQSLVKNATGYDLRHLMIGSEGTLALITKVTLALARPLTEPHLFVFGVNDLIAVMGIYHRFKSAFPVLAFEMFTDLALKHVLFSQKDLNAPFATSVPYYLVVEIENLGEAQLEQAMELFSTCVEEGLIADGILAQSPQQARDLWRLREDISEATSHGSPYKNDVSVRISKVPEFLSQMDQILKSNYPSFEVVWFGHIGDGNLHINILKPKELSKEEFLNACKRVDELMFTMIERLGGSISAEHGVGLTKKAHLTHTRTQAEITYLKGIKKLFDPDNILNPGKIFD